MFLPKGGCILASFVIICFPSFSLTIEWLPLTPNPSLADNSNAEAFLDEFRWLVKSGDLSSARKKALGELHNLSSTKLKKSDIAKVYVETFQNCYNEEGNEYLRRIQRSINSNNQSTVRAKNDPPNCSKRHSNWNTTDPYELWDISCSILPAETKAHSFPLLSSTSPQVQCCDFIPGSWTYLRLPAIHEPAIRLGIPCHHDGNSKRNRRTFTDDCITVLNLEQDGYLRPYDVAGILWPTSYMLSLCLGDLDGCPIPELRAIFTEHKQISTSEGISNQDDPPLALELGAGIGASSIALAKSLQKLGFHSSRNSKTQALVVASDLAPHALALTMANAKNNGVQLEIAPMDHFDQNSVKNVKKKFFPSNEDLGFENGVCSDRLNRKQLYRSGFSLVFGSSLQGLFQGTDRLDSALWKTLDQLLDSNNPNALAILAHNRDDALKVQQPPSVNNLGRRIV